MTKDNKEFSIAPEPRGEVLSFPRRISARLRAKQNLLLVSHDRPDGDALGSMAALALAAGQAGKHVEIICDDLPKRYAFLTEGRDLNLVASADFRAAADRADYILIMDTCTLDQLGSVSDALVSYWAKLLVMDHHSTSQDIAPIRWQDSSAAACGILTAELIADAGWNLTRDIAEALLTALCTDTGWLRFSNTDSRALKMAAGCVAAGADTDKLYRRLYQSDRPNRMLLMARALDSLELPEMPTGGDGAENPLLAVMSLKAEDFAITGATPDETEDIINEPMRIARVAVSILMVERDGDIRCSLRSRPDSAINVANIATCFGGGGHARAAGCRFTGSMAEARKSLIDAVIG